MKKLFFLVFFLALNIFSLNDQTQREFKNIISTSVFDEGEFIKIVFLAKACEEESYPSKRIKELNNEVYKLLYEAGYEIDLESYLHEITLPDDEDESDEEKNDKKNEKFTRDILEICSIKLYKFDNNIIYDVFLKLRDLFKSKNSEDLAVGFQGIKKFISEEKINSLYGKALSKIKKYALDNFRSILCEGSYTNKCSIVNVEILDKKFSYSLNKECTCSICSEMGEKILLVEDNKYFCIDLVESCFEELKLRKVQFKVSVSAYIAINYSPEEIKLSNQLTDSTKEEEDSDSNKDIEGGV